MILRSYQSRVVDYLTDPHPRWRGFAIAGCGSGKSFMIASSVARASVPGTKAFVGVCTVEQKDQMISAFGFVEGPENVSIDIECMAVQPDLSSYDLVVLDECAHLPAATWFAAAKATRSPVWGFSARPFGTDPERNAIIKDFFGDNFVEVTPDELRDAGVLTPGVFRIHHTDTKGEFDDLINERVKKEVRRRCYLFPGISAVEHERNARWNLTVAYVQDNKARNAKIVELAKEEIAAGNSTLVLVTGIEHGKALAAAIGAEAAPLWSGVGPKKRRDTIAAFKTGALKCLVGTGLLDEGFDAPIASRLILAASGRSPQKITQRVGRILRPFPGKDFGLIHEFSDAGASMSHGQHWSRVKVYRELGFSQV